MKKTMRGVTVLLSNELNKAVEARILEKNMTINQYLLELIKQDLATVDNKKPAIATVHDENDKLCDEVLNTDKTDDNVLVFTGDEQRLLDMLFEVADMKDKRERGK